MRKNREGERGLKKVMSDCLKGGGLCGGAQVWVVRVGEHEGVE